MKLIYKGICNDFEKLDKLDLPENAVKFKEPDTAAELNTAIIRCMIPVFVIIMLVVFFSFLLHGSLHDFFSPWWAFNVGIFLHFAATILHEFLHAICVKKNNEVKFYISPKNFLLFVICHSPISKRRFILLSLFPNIILGWIPLLIWLFVAVNGAASTILFVFSALNTLSGAGDYLNVVNTVRQMPKGSVHVHSGMNSYWYIP